MGSRRWRWGREAFVAGFAGGRPCCCVFGVSGVVVVNVGAAGLSLFLPGAAFWASGPVNTMGAGLQLVQYCVS